MFNFFKKKNNINEKNEEAVEIITDSDFKFKPMVVVTHNELVDIIIIKEYPMSREKAMNLINYYHADIPVSYVLLNKSTLSSDNESEILLKVLIPYYEYSDNDTILVI